MKADYPIVSVEPSDTNNYIKKTPRAQNKSFDKRLIQEQIGLTARKRQYILQIPVSDPWVHKTFRKALVKLKGVYLFNKIKKDIKLYGTNSRVLDVFGNYRKNLKDIMDNKKRIIVEVVEPIKKNPWIFLPTDRFIRIWSSFLLFLLMYIFIVLPLVISFNYSVNASIFYWIENIVDLFFFMDILITLNTGYIKNEELTVERKKIFLNYLKGFLLIDFLSVFLFHLFKSNNGRSNNLFMMLRLLKFNKIIKTSKIVNVIDCFKFKMHIQLKRVLRTHGGITRLGGLICLVIIISHFVACMWYYVAALNDLDHTTWVFQLEFLNDSVTIMYVRCIYFTLSVLTTVGFGDIHAFSTPEMILVIFWMLLGACFYSVLVGSISSVLSHFDIKVSIVNSIINEIDKFEKDFKVPSNIIKQMKRYIRRKKDFEDITDKERIMFIQEIPIELSYQIALEMYGGAFNNIILFQNQDKVFISDIVPRLKYVNYPLETFVYKKKEFADHMYFIVQGRVNYILEKFNTVFNTVTTGSHFGEIELIEKVPRLFTVITEVQSDLFTMTSHCFEYLLNAYPKIGTDLIKSAQKENKENARTIKSIMESQKKNDRESQSMETKRNYDFNRNNLSENWVFYI
jgi:Cyclic nucleotide-binding domain/Ion channel